MRAMKPGQPFLDVTADSHYRTKLAPTVFSEQFLYPKMGKDDARFILAVADEYARLIELLGPEAVAALLRKAEALGRRLLD